MSSIRANVRTTIRDLVQSIAILTTTFFFVCYTALLFFYLFRNTTERFFIMPERGEAIFQMVILLTTANFPDVMLPAYQENYFYAWLFVIYLIVGLFLLLNMLLAKVFANYKKQLEE